MTHEGEAGALSTKVPSPSLAESRRAALHAALGLWASLAAAAPDPSELYGEDGLPA